MELIGWLSMVYKEKKEKGDKIGMDYLIEFVLIQVLSKGYMIDMIFGNYE